MSGYWIFSLGRRAFPIDLWNIGRQTSRNGRCCVGAFGKSCGVAHKGRFLMSGLYVSQSARLLRYGRAAWLYCCAVRRRFEMGVCRRSLDGQHTVVHRTRVRSAAFASDLSKAAGMAYSRLADRCCNVGNRAHARDKSDQQLNFCTVMKRKLLLDFINASL